MVRYSLDRQNGTVSTSGRFKEQANGIGMHRVPSEATLLPTKRQLIWSKVEALAWLCAALFTIWYGNGAQSLLRIVRADERVKRFSSCSLPFGSDNSVSLFSSGKTLLHTMSEASKPLHPQAMVPRWTRLPWRRLSDLFVLVHLVRVRPLDVAIRTTACCACPLVNSDGDLF